MDRRDLARLGHHVVSRRVALGYRNRTDLASSLQFTVRTLADIEHGVRKASAGTYAMLGEQAGLGTRKHRHHPRRRRTQRDRAPSNTTAPAQGYALRPTNPNALSQRLHRGVAAGAATPHHRPPHQTPRNLGRMGRRPRPPRRLARRGLAPGGHVVRFSIHPAHAEASGREASRSRRLGPRSRRSGWQPGRSPRQHDAAPTPGADPPDPPDLRVCSGVPKRWETPTTSRQSEALRLTFALGACRHDSHSVPPRSERNVCRQDSHLVDIAVISAVTTPPAKPMYRVKTSPDTDHPPPPTGEEPHQGGRAPAPYGAVNIEQANRQIHPLRGLPHPRRGRLWRSP